MKSKFSFILFSIILIFVSCNNNFDIPSSISEGESKGSLSGVITYQNLESDNHGGILVTLDKTDGLRTASVTRAVENISSVSLARSLAGNTVTAQDGSYVFNNLEAGIYTVYASSSYSKEKAVCTNVVVRAGENTVASALQLTATGSIKGKITLDDGTSGNIGFLVFIAGTSYLAITDDAGNYTISDVPAGNGYQIVAMKNNVIHLLQTDVVVNANSSTTILINNFTSNELKATDGKDGADGKSIVWLGSFEDESEIKNPQYLNAYFNMTDGCSYIYDGTKWTLLSVKGDKGDNGTNGTVIVWKGELSEPPANPELNWAYYNTETGCSYIWNGTKWDLLSKAGIDGDDGTNGLSIVWKGELASEPENPEINWAYYNTETGCSYIWDGKKWDLLTKAGIDGDDGTNGLLIVWKGELISEPENPEINWAYYNTETGCSYIWNGTKWDLLLKAGVDGDDGVNALAIGTILSTEELINQDVIISINVTKQNLKKIGYIYSSEATNYTNATSVLNNPNFILISQDSNGKYKIVATKNGYYTFAVKDNDGYAAFTEEYISNIDKTPPATVTNLAAKYNKNTKVITVTWTNPTNTDLKSVYLSYSKGGNTIVSDKKVSETSYLLNNVEVDGDEYEFTLYAVDKVGNKSVPSTTSIIPVDGPKVQSISLNRYHWITDGTEQTVTATAIISNADLIEDGTIVKIQAKDQDGNVINSIATLDKISGKAVAIITVPPIVNETTYTVSSKIGNENADTTHTAHFNICWGADVNRISLSLDGVNYSDEIVRIPLADVTATSKIRVRIYGSNLDLKQPSIQFYDSCGVPYFEHPIEFDTSSLQWTATTGETFHEIETEINVPTIDDLYTVKGLIDGVVSSSLSRELQVYDIPKITNFTIPRVSITKKNNTVSATITGKNLDLPDFDLGDITAICPTNPNIVANSTFTKIDNNTIKGSFTIPSNIGEYEITINYGSTSLTSILKVVDFSSYSVGDVLLNDGTIIPYNADDLSFTNEQKQKAVGVLYGFDEYNVPCGFLGIHNSNEEAQYAWAIEYTTGNNMKFTSILCNYNGRNAEDATFLGDTDGSDNWANICITDPIGTTDAVTNYPAFNYVNNYAKKYGLTGMYSTHWYMPCLAELCYIYRNLGIINTVIDSLGGSRIWDVWYWSSSQTTSEYYDACAFSVRMMQSHGDIKTSYSKDNTFYVCCVRPF